MSTSGIQATCEVCGRLFAVDDGPEGVCPHCEKRVDNLFLTMSEIYAEHDKVWTDEALAVA